MNLEQLTVLGYLETYAEEMNGYDFYNYIFNPSNDYIPKDNPDLKKDYHTCNGIFLFKDEDSDPAETNFKRRIILKSSWEKDYMELVEQKHHTLCSGISYRGRFNKLENAQMMNALIFDLDGVGLSELAIFLKRSEVGAGIHYRALPHPTFVVSSGRGLHVYYVFDKPIALYPNIKIQLKNLKYDLTERIWEYKETTKEENIQFHSINQMFRMVGSSNPKHNCTVRAFKVGDRVSLEYLNEYVWEKNRVDVTKAFSPSKSNLKDAMEMYPQWYEDVVLNKKKRKRWVIERYGHDDALYQWWKKQHHKAKAGHRYFYLMCLAIYAVKCNVKKEQLKKDMYELLDILSKIPHENSFTERDVKSAMEAYSKDNFLFTIKDIEKLSAITIEKSKRNGREQADHIKLMNFVRDSLNNNKNWRDGNGRKPGSKNKTSSSLEKITEYLSKHPGCSKLDVIKATGISKNTVYTMLKHYNPSEVIICNYVNNNPGCSKSDVIKSTGLSKPTVYKYFNQIKETN